MFRTTSSNDATSFVDNTEIVVADDAIRPLTIHLSTITIIHQSQPCHEYRSEVWKDYSST